jgi:hypothetical protein
MVLGPHFTLMAKGCDYKIMRDFENYPKAVPWEIEFEFWVVTSLPSGV